MNSVLSPLKCTSAVEFTQKPRIRALSEGILSGERRVLPICTSVTVILFSVSVPVLSEQMTFMQPTVSQATSFLTSAFCFDILIIFIAKVTATIVGRPSGTAATMSTMLSINAAEISVNISAPLMPSKPATASSII